MEILNTYGFIVDTAEDGQEALDSGMNGFISKPIRIEELMSALTEILMK